MNLPGVRRILPIYDVGHIGVVAFENALDRKLLRELNEEMAANAEHFEERNRTYKHVVQNASMLYVGAADSDRKSLCLPVLGRLHESYKAWYEEIGQRGGFHAEANSIGMHHYRKGDAGITPHLEHVRYINLVTVFTIAGAGPFTASRQRDGPHDTISTMAGMMVCMRAPRNSDEHALRPFHGAGLTLEDRFAVIFRQVAPGMEKTGRP